MHSSFGQKIEWAVRLRTEGRPVAIVSEQHWTNWVTKTPRRLA